MDKIVAALTTLVWTAACRLEVHSTHRYDEDGQELLADVWVVYVTAQDGTRYQANRVFSSLAYRSRHLAGIIDEDGRFVGPEQLAALAFVEKVEKALAAGADPRQSDKWFEIQPAYGSEAYCRNLAVWEAEADALDRKAATTEIRPSQAQYWG